MQHLTVCTTCSPSLFQGLRDLERGSLCAVCDFSHAHLSDILRRTGESYAEHGCQVASVLSENSADVSLLKVAVLHDVLLHKNGPALLSKSPLSKDERELIVQMHGLRRLHIDESTKDLDTVINAFMEDTRLLPLRMAHRLNDVRHLQLFLPTLRKQIAKETLHMYTAIAGRLGMHAWRYEMEDACFPIVQPKACANLREKFSQMEELDKTCLTHTQEFLMKNLQNEGISCHMDVRVKGLYSTYRKMVIKKRRFQDLTDRLAVRIVVPEVMDCYKTLAVVHACMHPIPGKLKDYIGAPKENGYQSIHTVVYPLPGVTEQPMEIQIRAEEMHRICEHGHASHAEYKTLMYALHARSARVNLFRNLQSLREEARSPQQFQEAMRKYFREDHVAIFDGDDNLYHFKQPVSAMDFVCTVHPSRCDKLKEIRINGRKMQLSSRLQDGDIVEVRFAREKTLQADWSHACCHLANKRKLSALSAS
ncbi:hypothetical protein COU78_03500 [Candidatus Peregrinibacteria bacterium CG10_big_fil_rev_8_21_14_0_10_49_24]|nr:MAG: hypothetical protein COV83_05320 [Candidatus Peregrinibacteria bacterium CG11_big_fil_rev_8_21_14_0_20_49_14]PIR51185.1 MAG: hypothetical protein COU78_03500 [Candidatus Peregrinibacteria bacterium CG10_big_fil_rev_8_21_14_0_10_49_24]PJA67224.1 MAG: hypothetical protein CO157_05655 [Candidatus Peregrinibacteria bacterium CG_4_9_14_3_um_filter_49_12]